MGRLSFAIGLFTGLSILLTAAPHARAVEVTWGMLVSDSGQNVNDWWVQEWIDEYFEDGSRNDGVVNSNIVIVGTSCYFGDFEDNFNNTLFEPVGGSALDAVRFTNIGWVSAQEAGGLAVYGGFDDDAAAALKPGNTLSDVFDAGVAGKHHTENAQEYGTNHAIGGITGTHVLIWAGDPNHIDREQIAVINDNFAGAPNTTVTTLAGDGTVAEGGVHVDGAARASTLESALQAIGGQMDDGLFEQFIFFITDHGTYAQGEIDLPPIGPVSAADIPVDLPLGLLSDLNATDENQPTVQMDSVAPISAPGDVLIRLNGNALGTLLDAELTRVVLPDGSARERYIFDLPGERFFDPTVETHIIRVENRSASDTLEFDELIIGAGGVPKLVVPEPASATTLLVAAMSIVLRRKSRRTTSPSCPRPV